MSESEARDQGYANSHQTVGSCRAAALTVCGTAYSDGATLDLRMVSRYGLGPGKRESKHKGHASVKTPV
jgi:hypothetical protein